MRNSASNASEGSLGSPVSGSVFISRATLERLARPTDQTRQPIASAVSRRAVSKSPSLLPLGRCFHRTSAGCAATPSVLVLCGWRAATRRSRPGEGLSGAPDPANPPFLAQSPRVRTRPERRRVGPSSSRYGRSLGRRPRVATRWCDSRASTRRDRTALPRLQNPPIQHPTPQSAQCPFPAAPSQKPTAADSITAPHRCNTPASAHPRVKRQKPAGHCMAAKERLAFLRNQVCTCVRRTAGRASARRPLGGFVERGDQAASR